MEPLSIRWPNAPLHLHTESLFNSFLTLCQQKSSQSFSKVVSHCSVSPRLTTFRGVEMAHRGIVPASVK